MKKIIYIALVLLLGSFIYNLVSMDYGLGILDASNRPFIIGLGAGICGLILCFIFLNYYRLKSNLDNRSTKA